MEQELGMRLGEDEAKILIEMILDDLDGIRDHIMLLETLEQQPVPVELVIKSSRRFIFYLALGKAAIARMLIEKDEGARPSEVGMELIAKWERIEDEIIKEEANNEQED